MNYATLISPTDLRDDAKVRGWTSVPEAIRDRLFVLNNPTVKYRQIIVPMDTDRPDYDAAVRIAIERLSEVEDRPFRAVEAAQLRHTESGSFVLKIACPIDALPAEDGPLFPKLPFVRRVMLGMSDAVDWCPRSGHARPTGRGGQEGWRFAIVGKSL